MTRDELFSIWAPADSIWSPWAKGVLFAHYQGDGPPRPPSPPIDGAWIPTDGATAIVLDLPGALGVDYGLELARIGYRPVPLYNAAPSSHAYAISDDVGHPPILRSEVVDVRSILDALSATAAELQTIELPPDAPPAFLLDENRRYGDGIINPGRFDSRSVCFAADFPSAVFLSKNLITRILLVRESDLQPQSDAAHAFRRWQDAGLTILSRPLRQLGAPTPIDVPKPSFFTSLWQRLAVATRLRRNPMGGFGRGIPLYGAG
jgi:hypothetical protein